MLLEAPTSPHWFPPADLWGKSLSSRPFSWSTSNQLTKWWWVPGWGSPLRAHWVSEERDVCPLPSLTLHRQRLAPPFLAARTLRGERRGPERMGTVWKAGRREALHKGRTEERGSELSVISPPLPAGSWEDRAGFVPGPAVSCWGVCQPQTC